MDVRVSPHVYMHTTSPLNFSFSWAYDCIYMCVYVCVCASCELRGNAERARTLPSLLVSANDMIVCFWSGDMVSPSVIIRPSNCCSPACASIGRGGRETGGGGNTRARRPESRPCGRACMQPHEESRADVCMSCLICPYTKFVSSFRLCFNAPLPC